MNVTHHLKKHPEHELSYDLFRYSNIKNSSFRLKHVSKSNPKLY